MNQAQEILSSTAETEWYLIQRDRKQGPYSYYDVLKKLQNKDFYGSELAQSSKSHSQSQWIPLSCIEDFSEERVREFIKSNDPKLKEALVERKNPRIEKIIPVFVHDGLMVWRGKTFSVGTHGAGIILQNPFFEGGDILQVHFCCSSDGSKSFNTKVEVLSKKVFDKFISPRTSVKYSLLFKDLNSSSERIIKSWVKGS